MQNSAAKGLIEKQDKIDLSFCLLYNWSLLADMLLFCENLLADNGGTKAF